jgi:GTP-binding protein Era
MTNISTQCGFVAILGEPNAGKSTLVNQLVGRKVSIVSPKVQTTRMRVMGVCTTNTTQIILIDTPGIFEANKRFEQALVTAAWQALEGIDYVAVVIDSTKKDLSASLQLAQKICSQTRNACVVLNKVDLVPKTKLLEIASHLNALAVPVFMVSAHTGNGVGEFKQFLTKHMPNGPWHFPPDQLSDLPQRLMAAEVTREHLFRFLHDELPYGLVVETEAWEQFANGAIKISQRIVIQEARHKPMVLGAGGHMLKRIGQKARTELKQIFNTEVHLMLHISVDEKWQQKRHYYDMMGLI